MDRDDPVSLDGKYVMHTPLAVLIKHESGDVWLPLSQVFWRGGEEGPDEFTPGEVVEFDIPNWLAMKKGMV